MQPGSHYLVITTEINTKFYFIFTDFNLKYKNITTNSKCWTWSSRHVDFSKYTVIKLNSNIGKILYE